MSKVALTYLRPSASGSQLNLLSHREISEVMNTDDQVFKLFKECALAVLNTGSEEDDITAVSQHYNDFNIEIIPESRGIKLAVYNAPVTAFVDGIMIQGIREHLFSVLRDIIYSYHKISQDGSQSIANSETMTDSVFRILRNAGIVRPNLHPKLIICWGGHAIKRHEYDYSKRVGYELGLRGLNVATGCGIGAMKGPMKGAMIGHGKQQLKDGRYVGISEPGIIASESPNPIVNELVILPDIEKRLEAFTRLAHGIIVFPGGAGTAEEILYLLSILMHPANKALNIPVIFTAGKESSEYFSIIDSFIENNLGSEAKKHYEIIIDDPVKVAQRAKVGTARVQRHRLKTKESYAFNWQLHIPKALQLPFEPTHENMLSLALHRQQPSYQLAAELRKAFSGIVAGNVKPQGIAYIKQKGPYQLSGSKEIVTTLELLLKAFINQGRMKLRGNYTPCFELINSD